MMSRSTMSAGVSSSEMCMPHYSMRTRRMRTRGPLSSGKLPGIDPGLLDHRPPIDRETPRHVFVGKPGVAAQAPSRAPGIPHQQRAGVRADGEVVVVTNRDIGV